MIRNDNLKRAIEPVFLLLIFFGSDVCVVCLFLRYECLF